MIVSANGFDTDRAEAMNAGADGYLVKPVRMAELKDRLRELLGLHWTSEAVSGKLSLPDRVVASNNTLLRPDCQTIKALAHYAQIGHISGIVDMLEELRTQDIRYQTFAETGLLMARQFRLRELQQLFLEA
ncbi:MAG: hypothetical protein ACR2HF_14510 [Methylococcaceae bacterium]